MAESVRPSLIDASWDKATASQPAASGRAAAQGLAKAESLLAEGMLEEAWEMAEVSRRAFAAVDPLAETDALFLLARIAQARGFLRVGEERIARAIADRSDLAENTVPLAWYELHGTLAGANGEHQTAIAAWGAAAAVARAQRDSSGDGGDRLCIALRALGEAYLAAGDKPRAREVFTTLVTEARALVAAAAEDAHVFRHLTSALQRLGDAYQNDGDAAGAISAYRDAVRESKRAAVVGRGKPEFLWDLSVGLNRLGNAQMDADQAQAAIASFEQAIEARRTFADLTGRSPQAVSALASSLAKLGAALAQEGEEAASRAALDEAAALDREAAISADHNVMTMVPPPIR